MEYIMKFIKILFRDIGPWPLLLQFLSSISVSIVDANINEMISVSLKNWIK